MEMKAPESLNNGSMPLVTQGFGYEGVWYPPLTLQDALDKLKTFEVREDDIILVTYPKSGTHWIMEILLLIQQDGHVENVKRGFNQSREFLFGISPDFKKCIADMLPTYPSPRFYRTHLPSQHLPPQVWTKKPKVVYVTRDPKDCCASYYRFLNGNPKNPSDIPWEMFFNNYISEKAIFGKWCDHALGFWKHRDNGHVFFVTFEEMKQDIRLVTRRLATFLGKTISSEGLDRIVEHSSFDGMRRTYSKIEEEMEIGKLYTRSFGLMPFLQKGTSGGWTVLFSEEQRQKMDKIMKERLVGTGLDVHYPL